MAAVDNPWYLDFLPKTLLQRLDDESEPVGTIAGLKVAKGLRGEFPEIETEQTLRFVCDLYRSVHDSLVNVLQQRQTDREFIDRQTLNLVAKNQSKSYLSPEYETVIGEQDADGRIVIGPLPFSEECVPVDVPEFLRGDHVTLFGPADTSKMAINAMNALNRQPTNEPAVVTRLVKASGSVPRWGADNEDSKTPIMKNFLEACRNLVGCFDRTIRFDDPETGKTYELDETGLSIPIKRIPGLALPDGNHLLDGNPLPLHLFDFAIHLFHNWQRAEALVFYIPKLENEIEAAYVRQLVSVAEEMIRAIHPEYRIGTVRLLIVFENPRAIFRIREIACALDPYFIGGSLGWHDFLASTARLFKNDPNYRIPVKADANIVINQIRESHHLLVDALAPIEAIRIGGMYGVLFEANSPVSYEVSMVGFIKDVVTQLKRGLTGFWVAHPSFVRPGIALVEAFRRRRFNRNDTALLELIRALVPNDAASVPLLAFVTRPDGQRLDKNDPNYLRGILAANIASSEVVANDAPEEVRYNIFQALQYLTAWLCGNGCVALPATMNDAHGNPVFVRIMDDLATTERSRWELWAEVNHGRVSIELFDRILSEELAFIRNNQPTETKRTQVPWRGPAARWYPVAAKILRQLVCDANPVEFATELLLPFTFEIVRQSKDPWSTVIELCPGKFV